MFSSVFSSLLGTLQGILDYFAQELAFLVISLAFMVFATKCVISFFREGYDRAVVTFKDFLVRFVVILGLSLPIAIPPIDGGSILSTFPKVILNAGFSTAEEMVGHLPANSKGGGTLDSLPENLTNRLWAARGGPGSFEAIIEQAQTAARDVSNKNSGEFYSLKTLLDGSFFKTLFYAIIIMGIFFIIAAVVVIIAPPSLPFVVPIFISLALLIFTAAANVGNPSPDAVNRLAGLLQAVFRMMADYIFVAVLTFAFYGTLFTAVIKGTIYSITFPISIGTIPFESQKGAFFSHVTRGFQIALVPILAAVIFAVAFNGYAFFTANGGLFDKMVSTFVSFNTGGASFWEFVMYIFRYIFAMLIAPIAIAGTIARYMLQVPRIASELIGNGITYSSGMAEGIAGMGTRRGGGR